MSAARNDIIVSISARTDVGMRRKGNEDCFLVADLSTGNVGLVPEVSTHRLGDRGSLLVVSDGMGGAVAGEIASDLSTQHVREALVDRDGGEPDVSDRLRHAVEAANYAVWSYAQENPQFAGMGATITAVLAHARKAYVAQVGDSRAYLVRAGRIKQLTKDQSLVQLLIDSQAIQPEQADQVPNNVILQALGTRSAVSVAMTSVDLCRDDYILLCSDGLSNKVTDAEMRDAVVRNGQDLSGACRSLIELANARGGEDNITVLAARFDGEAMQSASERSSITGSMHALTSTDLSLIGGAQLDHIFPPAPNAGAGAVGNGPALGGDGNNAAGGATTPALDAIRRHAAPQPGSNAVTQVGFRALAAEPEENDGRGTPPAPAQFAPAPQPSAPAAVAAPAPRGSSLNRIILAVGILLFVLGLTAAAAFAIYFFFFHSKLDF